MRFVRLLAASAALACSMLAGQAQAAVRVVYTTSNPSALLQSLDIILIRTIVKGGIIQGGGLQGRIRGYSPTTSGLSPYVFRQGWFDHYTSPDTMNFIMMNSSAAKGSGARFVNYQTTFAPGTFGLTGTFTGVSDPQASITISMIKNPYNVPEPATWSLLIVGFGAVGASLRRRARARQVVALAG